MQSNQSKLGTCLSVFVFVSLCTTLNIPSALAQNSQDKYGFIYQSNFSKIWHYMWGYSTSEQCENARKTFDNLNTTTYSVVYYCSSGEKQNFQDTVDRYNSN